MGKPLYPEASVSPSNRQMLSWQTCISGPAVQESECTVHPGNSQLCCSPAGSGASPVTHLLMGVSPHGTSQPQGPRKPSGCKKPQTIRTLVQIHSPSGRSPKAHPGRPSGLRGAIPSPLSSSTCWPIRSGRAEPAGSTPTLAAAQGLSEYLWQQPRDVAKVTRTT